MFRENTRHKQRSLFGVGNTLSETRLEKLKGSREAAFYELVFCRIPEKAFAVLYSDVGSRPNTPINVLVGAEVLKYLSGWTDRELCDQIDFNLKTRYALGIDDLGQASFCPATLYNFRNRLARHAWTTGVNLLEQVFDHLTDEQKKQLGLKDGAHRLDSFQAMSNISSYTRLRLVLEVLQRLWRILKTEDREDLASLVAGYVGKPATKIVYEMAPEEYEPKLVRLGRIYFKLHKKLKEAYGETAVFKVFERVYFEQYAVGRRWARLKAAKKVSSGSLQSPDDLEATYRRKKGTGHVGQAVHVRETCDPGNQLQLIDDVFVKANNVDDSEALNQRMAQRPERFTPVTELHVDGGYGSEANDRQLVARGAVMVQTGIRGRPPGVRLKITPIAQGAYRVACPYQNVLSRPTEKSNKAVFDLAQCRKCEFSDCCPAATVKQGRVYYFSEAEMLRSLRLERLASLPEERRTLRANVEATVKEFTPNLNHKGKLRVRGRFKTEVFALCSAIGINLGRIHRYRANLARAARVRVFPGKASGPAQLTSFFFRALAEKLQLLRLKAVLFLPA